MGEQGTENKLICASLDWKTI